MDWTLIVQTSTTAMVAIAAILVAVSLLRLGRHNRDLSAATRKLVDQNVALMETTGEQAKATRELAEEARTDRAVATGPLLVLLDEPPPGIREEPWAAVRVRNLGNGPALNVVIWMLARSELYRSAGPEVKGFSGVVHLASGDTFEPSPFMNMLHVGQAHGSLDPGSAVVGESLFANLIAYCSDQFGNRYRFNLRTSDPPEIWERGADAPRWAGAWDPPLPSAQTELVGRNQLPAMPERDVAQLVEALHELLHAFQEAAASG